MNNNFSITFLGLVMITILDSIYLTLNKEVYDPILDKSNNINYVYGVLTWLLIIISIQTLLLSRNDITQENSFSYGALLGLAMYGVYNFTNAAIYPDKWSLKIITTDTLWGLILTGSMTYSLHKLRDLMKY